MNIRNIIIIEDDVSLATQFKQMLELEKFTTEIYHSAEEYLFRKVDTNISSLYLIDMNLPGIKGIDLVKLVRYKDKLSPLFIISGGCSELDIQGCLQSGADDYLEKPYNPSHLLIKIQNAAKKFDLIMDSMMDVGIKLIAEANLVIRDGNKIKLTAREYFIIEKMLAEPNEIHTRESLTDLTAEDDVTCRSIDVHISSLRKKINDIGVGIETCRGKGYRIQLHHLAE